MNGGAASLERSGLTGAERLQIRAALTDQRNGQYHFRYTVQRAGTYLLRVLAGAEQIGGSPFVVTVQVGVQSPPRPAPPRPRARPRGVHVCNARRSPCASEPCPRQLARRGPDRAAWDTPAVPARHRAALRAQAGHVSAPHCILSGEALAHVQARKPTTLHIVAYGRRLPSGSTGAACQHRVVRPKWEWPKWERPRWERA